MLPPFFILLSPRVKDCLYNTAMWHLSLPWYEFVVRGVLVYVFLLVLLRITGKRQIGQLAPFDLILLLVLSNAVQNAMNGGDNSVLGGVISATTLVVLNWGVAFVTFRWKRLANFVEGSPVILVHNGHVDQKAMAKMMVTMHELNAALRSAGVSGPECVHVAILENNGNISVVPKK